LRIVGDREWSLNEGQIRNSRFVRVALRTGYHHVEGNRRASRNGLVSSSPTQPKPTQLFPSRSLTCPACDDTSTTRPPGCRVTLAYAAFTVFTVPKKFTLPLIPHTHRWRLIGHFPILYNPTHTPHHGVSRSSPITSRGSCAPRAVGEPAQPPPTVRWPCWLQLRARTCPYHPRCPLSWMLHAASSLTNYFLP
jgi:hypothetical protein